MHERQAQQHNPKEHNTAKKAPSLGTYSEKSQKIFGTNKETHYLCTRKQTDVGFHT